MSLLARHNMSARLDVTVACAGVAAACADAPGGLQPCCDRAVSAPTTLQEGPSHERCERVVLSALKHQAECGAPQLQCTFNGAWGGPRVPKVIDWERGMAKRWGWLGGQETEIQLAKGLHGRSGVAMHIPQASWLLPNQSGLQPPCARRCSISLLISGTAPPMRVSRQPGACLRGRHAMLAGCGVVAGLVCCGC